MAQTRRAFCTLAVVALVLSSGRASSGQSENADKQDKPTLTVRATPPTGFSPLRVRVTVELRGGANDFADYYCPSVTWDWGDDATSERSQDCDPYVAGTSEITRRYTAEHTYRLSGSHRLTFRLKQGSRVVATTGANIQVRPSLRDEFAN